MSDNIYNIDYSTLNTWLTPEPLRQDKWLRFLGVLVSPVVYIYQNFLMFRTASLYNLKITPQKCYLELLLNDRYDFTLRRIYIDDGIDKPPFYIFVSTELKPKFIYKKSEGKRPNYIFTESESGNLTNDFVVYVPIDINFELPEMTSLVKAFKLVGTRFTIQRF